MISFRKAIEASYRLYLSFNKKGLQSVANGKLANRLLLYKVRDADHTQSLEMLSLGIITEDIQNILGLHIPHLHLSIYDKMNAFGTIDHKLPVHLFALAKPYNLEQVIVGNAAFLVSPYPTELSAIWKDIPI